MTQDKFRVPVTNGPFAYPWPEYFEKFWDECKRVAYLNDWAPITVANYELRPLGGRLIQTSTQGWYLRWDTESAHTVFVLKWS